MGICQKPSQGNLIRKWQNYVEAWGNPGKPRGLTTKICNFSKVTAAGVTAAKGTAAKVTAAGVTAAGVTVAKDKPAKVTAAGVTAMGSRQQESRQERLWQRGGAKGHGHVGGNEGGRGGREEGGREGQRLMAWRVTSGGVRCRWGMAVLLPAP